MRITIEPTEDQSYKSSYTARCRVVIEHRDDDLPPDIVMSLVKRALAGYANYDYTVSNESITAKSSDCDL